MSSALPRRRRWRLAYSLALLVAGTTSSAQTVGGGGGEGRAIPEGLRFANALLRDRRYEIAAGQYEQFLKTGPSGMDLADARFGLGRARLFLEDYPAARREFEAFLKIAPDDPNAATAAFRAGEAAYLMKDFAAARLALSSYLESYPEHGHRETAWPELGDSCYHLNDLAGAKRAYEKALELEPAGRLANRSRFFLGRTLATLGETDASLAALDALAGANDPDWSGKARLQAGQVLLAEGRAAEAAERFAAIEAEPPAGVTPAEARLRRSEALIALGRHDEAEGFLAPLAADGSLVVAPPAAFALAGSQTDRGRWADCVATCDAAIRRVPESPWVPRLLYRAAEAQIKLDKADDARVRFLKVAEEHPKDAWAPTAMLRAARLALDGHDPAVAATLADEFATRFPDDRLRDDARLIAARAALDGGRAGEAVAILEPMVARAEPGNEMAQSASYYLGIAYKADGQSAKATALLEGLAKVESPASADARLVVGFHQFEAKNYASAAEALEGYIAAKPDSPDAPRALAYLAMARQEMGQEDASRSALDRLAKDWPSSDALPRARIILGESALKAGRYDEAVALFLPVAEANDPAWKPRALSGLGWAQLQGGQPEDAVSSFSALLDLAPEDPLAADAAMARARALEAAGKTDEALASLDVVARKYAGSPGAEAARVTRARLLARAGKPAEAAEALGDFLEDHPQNPPGGFSVADLLVERGWDLHDAGKTAEADSAFRQVLEESPDGPRAADARVFLAESLHAAGKTDEAEAMLGPVVADGAKADPSLVQAALLRLGKIALARGDATAAASIFDRLIVEFPEGPYEVESQFERAEADLQAGKPQDAEKRFAELAGTDGPKAARWASSAAVRRVQCLVAMGLWEKVPEAADAAMADPARLTPSQVAEVEYARGRALFTIPDFDAALAAYQAAIVAAPGSEVAARAQFMRGETFFHKKSYTDALREFHKTDLSYRAPEWQAAALFEAAKVYVELGRWTEAADVCGKILANFPKDARIDQVKRLADEARAKASPPSGNAPIHEG